MERVPTGTDNAMKQPRPLLYDMSPHELQNRILPFGYAKVFAEAMYQNTGRRVSQGLINAWWRAERTSGGIGERGDLDRLLSNLEEVVGPFIAEYCAALTDTLAVESIRDQRIEENAVRTVRIWLQEQVAKMFAAEEARFDRIVKDERAACSHLEYEQVEDDALLREVQSLKERLDIISGIVRDRSERRIPVVKA